MHVSKELLELTLNEILNDERKNEETKRMVQEDFTSGDETIINDMILRNLIFFSRYQIIKDIYKSEEFLKGTVELLETEDNIRLNYFIGNLENQIDIRDFLRQDLIVEKLLSSDKMINYFARYIDSFFEIYEEPIKSKLLQKYLNVDDITISLISPLSEEMQLKLLEDEAIKNSIYDELIARPHLLRENNEHSLYETFKDRFKSLSLSIKVDIFSHLSDETLKKQAVEEMELFLDIDNISNYDFKNIAPYISQDILLKKAMEAKSLSNGQKYWYTLTSENQLKLAEHFIENKVNIFTDFEFNALKLDVKETLFENYSKAFKTDFLYKLYKETGKINYLEQIKNRVLLSDSIIFDDYLYEDDFINLLTEDDKNQIVSKLYVGFSFPFPSNKIVKYNDCFFELGLFKMVENLEEKGKKTSILFAEFQNYLTPEQQEKILPHLDLEQWLYYILSKEECFEFFLNLLNKYPTILKDEDFSKSRISSSVNENLISRIDELLPFFSDEQLVIFFDNNVLDGHATLKNLFREKTLANSNLLSSSDKLKYFSEEEQNNILKTMNIEKLVSLIGFMSEETPEKVVSEIKLRINEYIAFCNTKSNNDMDKVWQLLSAEERNKILVDIQDLRTLNDILRIVKSSSKEERYALIARQLAIINSNFYEITSDLEEIPSYTRQKLNLEHYLADDFNYLLGQANLEVLMYLSTYYSSNAIRTKIFDSISRDINCLLDDRVLNVLDKFAYSIPETDRKAIEGIIDNYLSSDTFYNQQILTKAQNLTLSDKIKYMNMSKNSQLDLSILVRLIDKNPYVLNTLNPILLDSTIIQMGNEFLEKTSKYPNVEKKLKIACQNNPDCATFLVQVSNYLQEHELYEVAYDKKISMVIEYLSHYKNKLKDFDYSTVNEDNLLDIINYILYNHTNVEVIYIIGNDDGLISDRVEELYEFKIDNFTETRIDKCDELFEASSSIDEMKNIYFNKYLSMSLKEATNFHKSYIVNWDKVQEYSTSDTPDKFISLINKIIGINDTITLRELYNTTTDIYDIGDRFTIESIMQKAYYESITKEYQNKQNGTELVKEIKDKNGNFVKLEMTELLDNFGILVHSTCAYGEMPLIDDDYFTSWNNNPNTANHGICCSYITNSSYGTADVKNTGVMFGFLKLNNNSIATYSPYDLATKNDGYNITSVHTPFYTTLEEIPNCTRHTHNEFDLERRNYSLDMSHSCVQPDCIIILEDMDESIKANSIKAYEDFKKHGIDLKLIYINKEKIAQNESNKLEEYIGDYLNTYDLDTLAKIINIYESNICGCDHITSFDADKIFMTDKVHAILEGTISYLSQIELSDFKVELVNKFVDILNKEQYKFDLLDDFNKKRAHTFKLYDEELRKKVRILEESTGSKTIEKGKVA